MFFWFGSTGPDLYTSDLSRNKTQRLDSFWRIISSVAGHVRNVADRDTERFRDRSESEVLLRISGEDGLRIQE